MLHIRKQGKETRTDWVRGEIELPCAIPLPQPRYNAETVVPLRIAAADITMRSQAKAAGRRWNPEKQRWLLKYGKIAGTPLEKHL